MKKMNTYEAFPTPKIPESGIGQSGIESRNRAKVTGNTHKSFCSFSIFAQYQKNAIL